MARRDALTTTSVHRILGGYRDFFGISDGAGCSCAPSPAGFPRWAWSRCSTAMLDDHRYLVQYSFDPEALAT